MNRRILAKLTVVIAAAALCVVALSATSVKQIHPLTGGTNAPVRIAIIADHYTNELEFGYDVENFIKYGLLADPFYQQHGASMHIASYYDDTPAGQDSRFGFVLGPGPGACAVNEPSGILSKLMDATAAATELPTHYVVLANHPYNVGCTIGKWSYVAVDAVGTDVLQHELGHLVGLLYDEWAMPSYGGTAHPGLVNDQYNCAPKPSPGPPVVPEPYWMNYPAKFPGAGKIPGCDLYKEGVVHAHEHCRMGAMNHRTFCYVCQEAMKNGFGYVNTTTAPQLTIPQPQASHTPAGPSGFRVMNAAFVTVSAAQPAPSLQPEPGNAPRPVMRVLVEFDPGSQAPPRAARLQAGRRVFAMSVYVPNYRRAGEFLYEISDNNGVRDVGVIPDSMFKARSFQGGPHATGPVQPIEMFLDLPNEDAKSAGLVGRNLKVIVYRIPRTVTNPIIDRNTWAELQKNPTHKFEKVAEMPLPPQQPALIKQ